MSSALQLAAAATVDVASGTTVTANDDDAVDPPYLTKDRGANVGASAEFEVACFALFEFANGS